MDILKYLGILLFTVFRKGLGVIWLLVTFMITGLTWELIFGFYGFIHFAVAYQFRGYARNTVYNYKLNKGLWLKRLYEREPYLNEVGWVLTSQRTEQHLRKGKPSGVVKQRRVTLVEYLFVYWFIWGWLDDDSNYDTMDKGFLEKVPTGEHPHPIAVFLFRRQIRQAVNKLGYANFGNSFELGDNRAKHKLFFFVASWLWYRRNKAYNFKYCQYESNKPQFYFRIGKYEFGWKYTNTVHDKPNYTLVFFS